MNDLVNEIAFGNIFDLREELASTAGFLPKIWAVLIKQFIPHSLLILFINLASSKNEDGDPQLGNFGGLTNWPFQVIGYGVVLFAVSLFFVGLVAPGLYEGLDLLDDKVPSSIIRGGEKTERDYDAQESMEYGGVDV